MCAHRHTHACVRVVATVCVHGCWHLLQLQLLHGSVGVAHMRRAATLLDKLWQHAVCDRLDTDTPLADVLLLLLGLLQLRCCCPAGSPHRRRLHRCMC